jgi:hypothetical protein
LCVTAPWHDGCSQWSSPVRSGQLATFVKRRFAHLSSLQLWRSNIQHLFEVPSMKRNYFVLTLAHVSFKVRAVVMFSSMSINTQNAHILHVLKTQNIEISNRVSLS